ncbi:hypothetical protein RHRU231_470002 [Rhodococcus ruber]|uniref:Uncharacterized protein n=1 Tax=Rhodococcus ruber TaxID=1830 RepID=A0A098BK64_9NOCA|nr:hypothetical protein RHRU231_470002 [Rhodococcus ruber]
MGHPRPPDRRRARHPRTRGTRGSGGGGRRRPRTGRVARAVARGTSGRRRLTPCRRGGAPFGRGEPHHVRAGGARKGNVAGVSVDERVAATGRYGPAEDAGRSDYA